MSEFIVSARKYRPLTFDSVVGQHHITQTLQGAISKNQLAHAYLFTGPRGVGKTTCARILAKTINCQSVTSDYEACGKCESCVAFSEGRSWTVHELDAASNNSVDDMRILTEKVRVAPQTGKYSVYIIDEVHMLSTAAFNAFLKTLEEPPAHAIFILATTEKHKILPTILSRCQAYDFKRITIEDIVLNLSSIAKSEGVAYDDESLNIIAHNADGGMRDALSTFDRVVSYTNANLTAITTAECVGVLGYNIYFKTIEIAQQEDYMEILLLLNDIIKDGFEPQIYLSGLSNHLRNLIVSQNHNTLVLLELGGDIKEKYREQSANLSISWVLSALNLIVETESSYRTVINKRLHCELALIKLCEIKKKDSGRIITDISLPELKASSSTSSSPTSSLSSAKKEEIVTAKEYDVKTINSDVAKETPIVTTSIVTAPTTTKPKRPIQLSPSINNILSTESDDVSIKSNEQSNNTHTKNLSESVEVLQTQWNKVLSYWQDQGRPLISTALQRYEIEGETLNIIATNESLKQEIIAHKQEIEQSIIDILLVRTKLNISVSDIVENNKPISIEQKMQFLISKNPNILEMQKIFDLTL